MGRFATCGRSIAVVVTPAIAACTNGNFATAAPPLSWSGWVDDPNVPEVLAVYAAKVLMKVLYAARYARFDLLRAVCALAQQVSKWDRLCDLKLYRLMCYINQSISFRMTGWIGDPAVKL